MNRIHALALAGALLPVVVARADIAPPPPKVRPVVAPQPAPGPAPTAHCTLKVINALPGAGGMDPSITHLRKRLSHAPFNEWKTFKVLSDKEEDLKEGSTATYPAPNGSVTVAYTGHKVHDGKHRIVGSIQIDSKNYHVKPGFAVDEGHPFLAAGEKYSGGILIYSLSCKTTD